MTASHIAYTQAEIMLHLSMQRDKPVFRLKRVRPSAKSQEKEDPTLGRRQSKHVHSDSGRFSTGHGIFMLLAYVSFACTYYDDGNNQENKEQG